MGILLRPLRPALALLVAALFEVSNGLRSHLPSGPGALPAVLPPALKALLTPCCGFDDSRGARNPRMSRITQMATTARMVMPRDYPTRCAPTRYRPVFWGSCTRAAGPPQARSSVRRQLS